MKYFFVYETFMGHRRIMAKRHKTLQEMDKLMKYFPGASYCEVDLMTYDFMHVGDAW